MTQDLDSRDNIARFLQAFYGKLLNDPVLAPIFLDIAGIDIRVHLSHIQAYWEKLLLGEDNYHRHTMNIHRALHGKQALTEDHFDRWLMFYVQAVDENSSGPYADKAKKIAASIVHNMKVRIVNNAFDTHHHH
jgi:hemoglobin